MADEPRLLTDRLGGVLISRDLCDRVLSGARHLSCCHDGGDPTFHCCDWGAVVIELEAAADGEGAVLAHIAAQTALLAEARAALEPVVREYNRCNADFTCAYGGSPLSEDSYYIAISMAHLFRCAEVATKLGSG